MQDIENLAKINK